MSIDSMSTKLWQRLTSTVRLPLMNALTAAEMVGVQRSVCRKHGRNYEALSEYQSALYEMARTTHRGHLIIVCKMEA